MRKRFESMSDFKDCFDDVFEIAAKILFAILLAAFIVCLLISVVRGVWVEDYPTPSEWEPSATECELIAQVLYNECRFLPRLEQSAVVWVILNRVDNPEPYYPDTVEGVVTQENQFAYDPDAPVTEELYALALDVMLRWGREHLGETDVGRTLPKEYVSFWGDGKHNYFRTHYKSHDYWDWSLANPYEEGQP